MVEHDTIIKVDMGGDTKDKTIPMEVNILHQGYRGQNVKEKEKNMKRETLFNKVQ